MGSSELKTNLTRTVAENKFSTSYLPIHGVDITTKRIIVKNQIVKLLVVDVAYQDYFGKLRQAYYQGACAFIIFFEKHDDSSFGAVPTYVEEIQRHLPASVPMILIGLITDDPEKVPYTYARKYALYWGLDFQAIKSTDELSFEAILKELIRRIFEKMQQPFSSSKRFN